MSFMEYFTTYKKARNIAQLAFIIAEDDKIEDLNNSRSSISRRIISESAG